MKIKTTSWLSFLVTLSALNIHASYAIDSSSATATSQSLESRLSRISSTLKLKENQLPNSPLKPDNVAIGWGDGRGSRGFVNTNRGGWGNGNRGGGFVNVNPWRNGWRDYGGFRNYGGGGGGFVNRGGGFRNYGGGGGFRNRGGGFVNRRWR